MSAIAWRNESKSYAGVESKLPAAGQSCGPYRYVKYVPVGYADTHSKTVGYLFWLFGFTGAHRFYYGKPLTGILWFFTLGLLGVGWLIDLFLIPAMDREADSRFTPGPTDYNLTWVLLILGGAFGLHRFVQGRWVTGLMYLATMGFLGLGVAYDVLTLNQQIDTLHRQSRLSGS